MQGSSSSSSSAANSGVAVIPIDTLFGFLESSGDEGVINKTVQDLLISDETQIDKTNFLKYSTILKEAREAGKITSENESEILLYFNFPSSSRSKRGLPGATAAFISAEAELGTAGQNLGRAEVKKSKMRAEELKMTVEERTALFGQKAAQYEAEYQAKRQELESQALQEQLAVMATINPAVAQVVTELKDDLQTGRVTVDEVLDLLQKWKKEKVKTKTKKGDDSWKAKANLYFKGKFQKYRKYAKELGESLEENKDTIWTIMKILCAGATAGVLLAAWTGSLPMFLATYFGGAMPYTAATSAWVDWFLSFVGTQGYTLTLGAAIWAWITANGTTVFTVAKQLINWVIKYWNSRGTSKGAFDAVLADIQDPNLKQDLLMKLDNAVANVKKEDPNALTYPPTKVQVDEADRQELDIHNTATASGSPADQAIIAVTGNSPNNSSSSSSNLFGSSNPYAISPVASSSSSSSSSSAASGGITFDAFRAAILTDPSFAPPASTAPDQAIQNAWNQGINDAAIAAAQITAGMITGGRRRRRTKRRGSRRSTKRSTRRSRKTKRGRKTKRSKRDKRSRRNR